MYFDHEKRMVYQKSLARIFHRGSAMESAVPWDVPAAFSPFPLDEIAPGKALLFSVVNMLSTMTERPEVASKEIAPHGSRDALED